MIVFVIYFNPSDSPGNYVVRRFAGMVADEFPVITAASLEEARSVIPGWCAGLARSVEDDPVIVETWF